MRVEVTADRPSPLRGRVRQSETMTEADSAVCPIWHLQEDRDGYTSAPQPFKACGGGVQGKCARAESRRAGESAPFKCY